MWSARAKYDVSPRVLSRAADIEISNLLVISLNQTEELFRGHLRRDLSGCRHDRLSFCVGPRCSVTPAQQIDFPAPRAPFLDSPSFSKCAHFRCPPPLFLSNI